MGRLFASDHGLEGWAAGWLVRRVAGSAGLILAAVVGGVIVVAGYFLADGSWWHRRCGG